MDPEARLQELGIELPTPPEPVATYLPTAQVGALVFVSGQLPTKDGRMDRTGRVGKDINTKDGAAMARTCALNVLAVTRAAVGSLNNVRRVVRLEVFVASEDGFTDQPLVANGASDLMAEVFGEAGRHARVAVGVSELPLGAPVEVAAIIETARP